MRAARRRTKNKPELPCAVRDGRKDRRIMSNKLFQGLIYQMKEELDCVFGVIDDKGVVIACSQLTRIGETDKALFDAL